ncbi:MAG TPA: GNAT family protein [Jatrophihabitans sp.]|nr:GNAT family protein [Jatrophihabitans sp.]
MTRPDHWYALPVLSGTLIRLEPLAVEHAPGYLAAVGTGADAEEVFRWLRSPGSTDGAPRTLDDAYADVLAALAARARGERFAYAQLDAATGEFAGTTSYYDIDPAARAVAIGHSWLGRRWWRTGHNTESKLLMLRHAFETLGAARVVWHTDIRNVRSQDAIARLGATREGELRKHRIRRDGSWRTTVQYSMTDDDWPETRKRLEQRLAQG